ncbi:hypothetical protein, partial [Deinococcus radiophilus]|uniref:hypothetical protein n=1 Tax=Deinococcus radiophilus TaxID=32062 RepID=UPI001B88444F
SSGLKCSTTVYVVIQPLAISHQWPSKKPFTLELNFYQTLDSPGFWRGDIIKFVLRQTQGVDVHVINRD